MDDREKAEGKGREDKEGEGDESGGGGGGGGPGGGVKRPIQDDHGESKSCKKRVFRYVKGKEKGLKDDGDNDDGEAGAEARAEAGVTPTTIESPADASGTPTPTPKLKATRPKGKWTQAEDATILRGRREGKSWQEITDAVVGIGAGSMQRTLTAVRLRYQKVLKDRDVGLNFEQLGFLKQAKRDVETTHKARYIAERFKELSKVELSPARCLKILSAAEKGEFVATGESSKDGGA